MSRSPVRDFVRRHFRHFNAAALVRAAEDYERHLASGGKMMVTLAGAMSTGELGLSLAEMIRRDKVHIVSCTGANLEEDVYNLVAHDHYVALPNYRDLSPEQERELLDGAIEGGHADEDFMALYLALREAARESTGAGERR